MGMTLAIEYPESAPAWNKIRAELSQVSLTVALRMIDNLPAFPDEEPEDGWREIRIGVGVGMITLRRNGLRDECIIWGNSDPALIDAWRAVASACASAGNGTVAT